LTNQEIPMPSLEQVRHYAALNSDYTEASVRKVLALMLERHGSLDVVAFDYYIRSVCLGGMGMGRRKYEG
jgi:hypothetical protein